MDFKVITVYRSYRIFYDLSKESLSVGILHVWHGARDVPAFRTGSHPK
jgi:plasmid stabilization system protein ParE